MSGPRLHLLLHPDALEDCLGQRGAGDAVVLCDRGVELLARGDALAALRAGAGALAVSGEDLAARGLPMAPGVRRIDDAGLVAMVAGHAQVLSWT